MDPALAVDAQYVGHITRMTGLLGPSVITGTPSSVLAFERSLAAGTMTDAEREDPRVTYHPTAWSDFVAAAPHFPWSIYLTAIGVAQPLEINVTSPRYLATLDTVLAGASRDQLQDNLNWTFVESYANAMGEAVIAEEAKFCPPAAGWTSRPGRRHARS